MAYPASNSNNNLKRKLQPQTQSSRNPEQKKACEEYWDDWSQTASKRGKKDWDPYQDHVDHIQRREEAREREQEEKRESARQQQEERDDYLWRNYGILMWNSREEHMQKQQEARARRDVRERKERERWLKEREKDEGRGWEVRTELDWKDQLDGWRLGEQVDEWAFHVNRQGIWGDENQ